MWKTQKHLKYCLFCFFWILVFSTFHLQESHLFLCFGFCCFSTFYFQESPIICFWVFVKVQYRTHHHKIFKKPDSQQCFSGFLCGFFGIASAILGSLFPRLLELVFLGLYVLCRFFCFVASLVQKVLVFFVFDCILLQSVSDLPKDSEFRLPKRKMCEFGNLVLNKFLRMLCVCIYIYIYIRRSTYTHFLNKGCTMGLPETRCRPHCHCICHQDCRSWECLVCVHFRGTCSV